MTIRPMEPADIPAVVDWMLATPLWQRYRLTEAGTRAGFERALADGDLLLVADVDDPAGRACGLAWCLRRGMFGRSAYLRILGVRDEFGGRGLGAVLLDRAETILSEITDTLFLLVSDFNADAQRFYERQGYVRVGALAAYVLPDVTEFLYCKRLCGSHHAEGGEISGDVR
jgi:ribosomal protein S18 acetylase RimI-like enzyme